MPNGYVMVEQGGVGNQNEKTRDQNPTVLRFDVDSLEESVRQLEKRGVSFKNKQLKFSWGTIGVFDDPDGKALE